MVATTPFHERLSELNRTGLYTHWQGRLSTVRYTDAPKHEYFAVRNSVGVFDTSPLYKYRLTGPDTERFLVGVLVRDFRGCRPGRAHYTVWCDDRGFVAGDGVAFRQSETEVLLTTARPELGYLQDLRGRLRVDIADVGDDHGILAVQGPRSRAVLAALTGEAEKLGFFEHTATKVGSHPVTLSRTGFTGDLGYELVVEADAALDVLDAVLEAGAPHGLRPFGEEALDMLRIEAGLPLLDVDFHDSRLAFTDHDRVTPTELGLGWMLRGLDKDRAFVGRDALRREARDGTSRWRTVGVVVDWADWDRLHREAGLLPTKSEHPLGWESMLYDESGTTQIGYVTSFLYSPVLQRHVGMARVRRDVAAVGAALRMETVVNHHNTTVLARSAQLPLFNPERKVSTP